MFDEFSVLDIFGFAGLVIGWLLLCGVAIRDWKTFRAKATKEVS